MEAYVMDALNPTVRKPQNNKAHVTALYLSVATVGAGSFRVGPVAFITVGWIFIWYQYTHRSYVFDFSILFFCFYL